MKRAFLAAGVGVAVFGLGTLVAGAAPTYVGAEKCKMCHRVEYESWAKTPHAQATTVAKEAKDRKFEPACLECHATNHSEALPGVQCEACHGAGSEYKTLSVMKDLAKAKAAGLVMPTQETCNRCHDGKDHHKHQAFNPNIHAHKAK